MQQTVALMKINNLSTITIKSYIEQANDWRAEGLSLGIWSRGSQEVPEYDWSKLFPGWFAAEYGNMRDYQRPAAIARAICARTGVFRYQDLPDGKPVSQN